MASYVERGREFEITVRNILREEDVEVHRYEQEPGDGGIDLNGGFRGYTIIVQCKGGWRIRLRDVVHLEGVLSRYDKRKPSLSWQLDLNIDL